MNPKTALLLLTAILVIGFGALYIIVMYTAPVGETGRLPGKENAATSTDRGKDVESREVSPAEVSDMYKELEKYKEEQIESKPYEEKTSEEKIDDIRAVLDIVKKTGGGESRDDSASAEEKIDDIRAVLDAIEKNEDTATADNEVKTDISGEKSSEEKIKDIREILDSLKNN